MATNDQIVIMLTEGIVKALQLKGRTTFVKERDHHGLLDHKLNTRYGRQ
jgi:hypothetical protein